MGRAGQTDKLKANDPLYALRHSTAHVMAQAVRRLYGSQVKLAIGPPIEEGFYYDVEMPAKLTEEDLPPSPERPEIEVQVPWEVGRSVKGERELRMEVEEHLRVVREQ